MNRTRDGDLSSAFVELADTLVGDFDVTDLMQRLVEHCVDLLAVDAAGLLLSDQRGSLQLMASSEEASRLLELFQLQSQEGPCLDAFHTGERVIVTDLASMSDRWPTFTTEARAQGFAAVHAIPLRLRDDVLGAMNLFNAEARALTEEDLRQAQALADIATIGLLQERAIQTKRVIVEQLQGALNSRVVIEQAKGLLANAGGFDMDESFKLLRWVARSSHQRLGDVALDLVEGRLDATALAVVPMGMTQGFTTPRGRNSRQTPAT